ncbi:MAG: nucleotide exchange factor GrpE, partial [Candidatus Paceibacterota bacterium]
MDNNKHSHKEADKAPEKPKEGNDAGKEKSVTIPEAEYSLLKEDAAKGQEAWDKMARVQADFDNVRKRLERVKQEFIKFANEGIIAELLNTLDDLERAVDLAESKHQDMPAFLKGIEMVLAHLYELLKKHGIKPMDALGKIFDPNCHEALMQVEDKNMPEHTVVEELQKGYYLIDRVIRTAKVKVSKQKTEEKEEK